MRKQTHGNNIIKQTISILCSATFLFAQNYFIKMVPNNSRRLDQSPKSISVDNSETISFLFNGQFYHLPFSAASRYDATRTTSNRFFIQDIPKDIANNPSIKTYGRELFWVWNGKIFKRRNTKSAPELVGSFKEPIFDFAPVTDDRIAIFHYQETNTETIDTYPLTTTHKLILSSSHIDLPWIHFFEYGNEKPIRSIPLPQSLKNLLNKGLILHAEYTTITLESKLFIYHPGTSRLFVLNLDSWSVHELQVPWRVVDGEILNKIKQSSLKSQSPLRNNVYEVPLLKYEFPGKELNMIANNSGGITFWYIKLTTSKNFKFSTKDEVGNMESHDIMHINPNQSKEEAQEQCGYFVVDLSIIDNNIKISSPNRLPDNGETSMNFWSGKLFPENGSQWTSYIQWTERFKPEYMKHKKTEHRHKVGNK